MKKKMNKNKISIGISVLLISFLLFSSLSNISKAKTLATKKDNQYITDYSYPPTWKWNITEVVSTESTDDSMHPSLAVDSTGNVHMAWWDYTDYAGSGTDTDIFYKFWNSISLNWNTTEVVSTESTSGSGNPSIAVDTLGNVHITWEDNSDYAGAGIDTDIFYKYWNATTSSWNTTEVVSTESTDHSRYPSLAVDSTGNVHIAWWDPTNYAGAGGDYDIFYKYWNAATSSWTITEVVSTESILHSYYPSLAVDTLGDVHVAWHDWTDYAGAGTDLDIFCKRWDSTITSWTTTEVVSTESTDDSYNPSLAVDTSGNVHIAWWDETDYAGSGTDTDIFCKHWNPATESWTITEVVSTESTSGSGNPSIAVDTLGNVLIAWEDNTNYVGAGADTDVFYKYQNAATESWTTTEVLSTESSDHSRHPSLATDDAGNVHIAWWDETNYAGSGIDTDIFYKFFTGPPAAPELASIVPNPNEINTVLLDWNDATTAINYYVYRSTSYIWSVEGLVPITTVSSSDYIDTVPAEGFYYYVVVAENWVGNSSHSNCQYVEYELPSLQEFVIVSSLVIGTLVILFVIMRTRKKNSKPN